MARRLATTRATLLFSGRQAGGGRSIVPQTSMVNPQDLRVCGRRSVSELFFIDLLTLSIDKVFVNSQRTTVKSERQDFVWL